MPVSRVECTKVRSLRGQKSVQLHTITVALGQVVLWAPKSVPIGLAMATAQNSCLGWPSRHILSAGSSLKTCCKIEVIVPFIIDFLEGLYILHTVTVVDDCRIRWFMNWRCESHTEEVAHLTCLRAEKPRHVQVDDKPVHPPCLSLQQRWFGIVGQIHVLLGVAQIHHSLQGCTGQHFFASGWGKEQNPRGKAKQRSTGTTWTTLVPHLW